MSENQQIQIKPLQPGDADQIIALDRALGEGMRADFFHKRLQAMNADRHAYIGFVARQGDQLCGFLLARVLKGEFGGAQPVALLDALGVASEKQHMGIGDQLMQALKVEAKKHGCDELRTQASWEQQELLAYFCQTGFTLAPRMVLACPTDTLNA